MEKVNILLVDDQPAKLLSYEAILAELGENLILANSGREALQSLLKHEVALILLDVVMPEMDGFETATLIRQHPRLEQTPIIFVTALSTSDLDRLKGYALGAVDYVFVPVVPEILRAKVVVFVELYRKRQELQNLNRTLEQRVIERTRQLEEANQQLEKDIAERKRAEAALRDSEDRFRKLANAAPLIVWTAAPDGTLTFANDQWLKFCGLELQENIKHWPELVLHPDDRERCLN